MDERVDWGGVALFVGATFALTWGYDAALWATGVLQGPLATLALAAQMLFPAIVAVAMVFVRPPPEGKVKRLGLRLGRRWPPVWAFMWLAFPLFALATPFVGALFGLYELDLQEFSGFRQAVEQAGGGAVFAQMTPGTLVAIQLVSLLIAPVINAPFMLGEELGWRGWLLPALRPLGQWPALLLSGVIWGLWHAPVIVMGHNYPTHPWLGIGLMVVLSVILAILFGWGRFKTGSVWPAVIAHGAVNGSAGVIALFHAAGTEFDTALVGLTGVTGWILPVLAIVALVLLGQLPVRDEPRDSTDALGSPPG